MVKFDELYKMGHEQVVYFSDSSCGLKAIVAIHNTTLGPALGGTRMWPYCSEEEALNDVLRLSQGMTYKAAISGLNLGGGKAVIIGDPKKDKSEALFRSYGRFLESLNGRYITAEDVNIKVEDVEHIFTETSNVVGVAKIHGGSGNPAPFTALGVFKGMEAACLKVFGERSLNGKVIALQGVGDVGINLCELLTKKGASIVFTDIDKQKINEFQNKFPQAKCVGSDEIYDVPCDIYSPCALGASINDQTVERLKCKIVACCANNQLDDNRHGQILKDLGILYCPDYLINAGGLMNVSIELEGWNEEKSMRMVDTIYETTLRIFKIAESENIPVNKAADLLAKNRIESILKINNSYLGNGIHSFPGRKQRN